MSARQKSVFVSTADTFEKWGRDYQAVAAQTEYIAARAAILREAAHYFACAARLRGQHIAPAITKPSTYRSRSREAQP